MSPQPKSVVVDAEPARWFAPTLLVIVGTLIAWAVLTVVGVRQQGVWPAAAAPFEMNRILIVHLLCLIPLGIWTARLLVPVSPIGHGRTFVVVATLFGLALAGATLLTADSLSDAVVSATTVQRYGLRLVWCWLLLLPWCLAAVILFRRTAASLSYDGRLRPSPRANSSYDGRPRPSPRANSSYDGRPRPSPPNSTDEDVHRTAFSPRAARRKHSPSRDAHRRSILFWADGLIAVLLATLPVVHVQQVVERQSALLGEAVINKQAVRAWQISRRLAVIGVPTLVGQPARDVVTGLRAQVLALRKDVDKPLPDGASAEIRLTRASQLYSLGRFDDVERLLQDLPSNPRAQQRLALSDEARQEYRQAADRYLRTLELLGDAGSLDVDQQSLLRSALERRVNNLRRIGETRQAESELLDAMKQWPQARDAILLQLGFHYQMAGRTSEAIDFFQRAADVNPRLQAQTDAARERLKRQAEGCLLRPARGATR